MLADQLDYVVGVDTHRDEHVLAVVVAPTGAIVAQRSVRANARGYAQALRHGVALGISMFTRRSPSGGVGKPCKAAWNITGRTAASAL